VVLRRLRISQGKNKRVERPAAAIETAKSQRSIPTAQRRIRAGSISTRYMIF